MGRGLQEEPPSLPSVFPPGALDKHFFYLHFYFFFQRDGIRGRGVGGMVCRLLCAHLAPPRGLGCGGGCECGAYWKMTGAPLTPVTVGGTSIPALRPQSAPASPQTPVAHPSGVSVLWARGTTKRLCPALGPHPRNAKASPPPHRHPALRTLEAIRGCLVCCCIGSVSTLPPPLVFRFFPPFLPSCSHSQVQHR